MRENVWILGITMTKFGRHRDKDIVDLASAASLDALADGGVSMRAIGVIAAGLPMFWLFDRARRARRTRAISSG